MAVSFRGGIPTIRRFSATTGVAPAGGQKVKLPSDICYLQIRALVNPVRLYFTEKDYLADEHYILVPVPAADAPYGEWQGPVETVQGSANSDLWVRGSGGASTVELVVFQRRG